MTKVLPLSDRQRQHLEGLLNWFPDSQGAVYEQYGEFYIESYMSDHASVATGDIKTWLKDIRDNTKHFINLTNGIDSIERYGLKTYDFIRIQSTHCENKRFDLVVQHIDANFLMNLALGKICCVHDYSQKRDVPRAIWQGLEFIAFCCNKVWFGKTVDAIGRSGHNMTDHFELIWQHEISDQLKNYLKYFRKFLNCEALRIEAITGSTIRDGKYDEYRNILIGG